MKVLFVSVHPPLPALGGAGLRGYNLIRGLATRHEVRLVCYGTVREELALKRELGEGCARIDVVAPPGGRPLWRRAAELAISSLPDLAHRFPPGPLSHAVRDATRRARPDILHVLGLESASAVFGEEGVLPQGVKTVLDELNAEFALQRRSFEVAAREARALVVAGYSLIQSQKLRQYEGYVCSLAAGVIAVSEEDQALLRRLLPGKPVGLVPNGVDAVRYRPAPLSRSPQNGDGHAPSILFTGTMDFRPNIDAVTWFVEQVLPGVRRVVPETRFVIAGRDPAPAVVSLECEGVALVANPPDDLPLFQGADCFVLPMRFGGGSRLKLLQAMACALPVVSTRLGASGVQVTQGDHLLTGDAPGLIAYYLVRLLRDREYAQRLGERARRLAEGYDWRLIVPRLEAFYDEVVSTT